MYNKSDSPQYSSSSLLSQALVIADSSGLGTLTSLTAVRQVNWEDWSVHTASKNCKNTRMFVLFGQILTADEDDQTDSPMQEDSLHMQPNTPVPGTHTHILTTSEGK